MSTSRLAALPNDHLVAEIAAFPLASEAALKLRIVALDPALSGRTKDLWREAERQVLGSFPAFSVDEAVAIRDRIWFGVQARGEVPLHHYLRSFAGRFLEGHGPVARPKPPHDAGKSGSRVPELSAPDPEPRSGRGRWAWRWLSLALPPDLLLAGLAGEGGAPAAIDLLSPILRTELRDRRYAETHLHLGAAMDFPLLWLGALYAVASPETRANAFGSPGAALREGNDLAPWLLRAAIARHVLASYLTRPPRDPDSLAGFVTEVLAPRVAGDAGAVLAATLHACLDDLLAGRLGDPVPGFADFRGLYWALTGGHLAFKGIPEVLDEAQAADPIAGFFPPAPPAIPEMRLVARALRYLDETPEEDHDFAVLFWQVVRVRALFYRHVVQRPMTAGLQWFIRFYGRIKPARKPIDKLRVESAAKRGGAGEGLRSLELRTGPEASGSVLREFVKHVHGAAAQVRDRLAHGSLELGDRLAHGNPELGLVFHFTKDRGGGAREGAPRAHRRSSHGDPCPWSETANPNPTGYRYARFYNGKRHEALALRWMLWKYPRSLALIRGIDVATDELGVPTWVLAPLFRYLRAISEAAAAVAPDGHSTLVPLRCTAHAGEDFVHLLTGLRNVEEAVRRLGLRAGDRIGHGFSLGVDSRDWCRRTGPVPIAVEERLLDLVWEWAWYGREGSDPPAGRGSFLDREIARLSAKVFRKPVRSHELEHFVECLYDEWVLRQMGFPNGSPPKEKLAPRNLELVRDYLTSADLFERGQETEWIDPSAEGEALAGLQAGVRRRLGQIGIAVEVNPTSNLLIGDLGDLSKHPLWRLRPPGGMGDAPPVSVCIGSDDPLTFATDLRAEYQLVHDTLVLAGRSEAEAGEWIDAARKTGLAYRFTVPWQSLPPDVWKAHRANPAPFPLHPPEPP